MKVVRQVGHVARKDVRTLGWLLFLHMLVVAVVTASAIGVLRVAGSVSFMLVVASGMVAVGMLLQADPASRVGAFWASRPLHPSAVFGAKLAVGLTLVAGAGVAGELVALRAHDVAWSRMPALLGGAALGFGEWLTLAAVIAAVTPDTRSFLTTMLLVCVAWIIVPNLIVPLLGDVARLGAHPGAGRLLTGLAIVGGLLLVWRQYRVRDRRGGLAAAGFLTVLLLVQSVLPVGLVAIAEPASTAAVADRQAMAAAPLRIVWTRSMRNERPGEVWAGAVLARQATAPRHAYLLVVDAAEIVLPDGTRETIGTDVKVRWLYTPNLVVRDGAAAIGSANWPRGSSFHHWEFDMNEAQRTAVRDGRGRVVLHGRVHLLQPRLAALLPIEPGAAAAHDGHRLSLEGVQRTGDELALTLRSTTIEAGTERSFGWIERDNLERGPYEYALLTAERQELLPIHSGSRSGSSAWLVLPGARVSTYAHELETPPTSGDASAPPLGADPKLAVIDWEVVATRGITTEIPNHDTTGR